jgi:hypothetical protein
MRQKQSMMAGALAALLLGTALLTSGCTPPPSGQQQGGGQQGAAVQTFDDLAKTDKLVMTTKAESDLPKTWTYTGQDAQTRAAKLISVLKQGQEMAADKPPASVPYVMFIFDFKSEKTTVNVYQDRFEFNKKWYKLDNAPELTYGSIEELRK